MDWMCLPQNHLENNLETWNERNLNTLPEALKIALASWNKQEVDAICNEELDILPICVKPFLIASKCPCKGLLMVQKSGGHQSGLVGDPIIYRVLYIPGGDRRMSEPSTIGA